jgi:hypothetical protein
MKTIQINCQACGKHWPRHTPMSDWEKQVLESTPCPACGCTTLITKKIEAKTGFQLARLANFKAFRLNGVG